MAIDPSIALQVKQPQLDNPMDAIGKAISLRSMLAQGKLIDSQIANLPLENQIKQMRAQAELTRAGQEAEKNRHDIGEAEAKSMAQLAGVIATAPPEQRAALYPAVAAEWKRRGLPGSEKVPDQWDESLLPNLQAIFSTSISADKLQERGDYAALSQQPQGVPSDAPIVRPYAPNPDAPPLSTAVRIGDHSDKGGTGPAADDWGVPGEMRLADENVTAKPPEFTPEWYRAEARRLEGIPTKAAAERAKLYREEANKLDDRIWKERDQAKPGSIPAGVIWDSSSGQYKMDGRVLTGAEVQAMDLKGKEASATKIPIHLAGNKYAEAFGTKIADRDVALLETAENAVGNVEKLDQLIDHLKTSDAITGMGAEVFKDMERARALFTASTKAGKRVSDTELLDAFLGSDVFPLIKALGVGARGMDTPAEREFLRSVMTGTIEMNKDTLIKMAEIRRDIAVRAVEKWNERSKNMPSGAMEATGVKPGALQVPARRNSDPPPMTATNPQTGQKIQSNDGGKTWQPIQ